MEWTTKATDDLARETNPDTFIASLQEAEARISETLTRLERLTDNLCGPGRVNVPANERPHVVANGVFETASHHGRSICEAASRANDCLDRIERSLP